MTAARKSGERVARNPETAPPMQKPMLPILSPSTSGRLLRYSIAPSKSSAKRNLWRSTAQEGHPRCYALGGHNLAPLAGVEVGSERDVALVREATSHVLYVIDE